MNLNLQIKNNKERNSEAAVDDRLKYTSPTVTVLVTAKILLASPGSGSDNFLQAS